MQKISIAPEKIKDAIRQGKYIITTHAYERMGERQITLNEVFSVILNGEIIEQYPRARPYPKCLFLGFVRENEPLYVSCAYDGERVRIITVHWFDPERWIDYRTRRR